MFREQRIRQSDINHSHDEVAQCCGECCGNLGAGAGEQENANAESQARSRNAMIKKEKHQVKVPELATVVKRRDP